MNDDAEIFKLFESLFADLRTDDSFPPSRRTECPKTFEGHPESVLEKRPYFMNAKHLVTYMKDHFAGSVAADELLDHLISSNCGKTNGWTNTRIIDFPPALLGT